MSPEQTARIQQIRARCLAGQSTIEEEKEAILILRGDRMAAQASSSKSRTKKAEDAAPVDTKSVLAGFAAKMMSGPVA